jgi:hypothetical protein
MAGSVPNCSSGDQGKNLNVYSILQYFTVFYSPGLKKWAQKLIFAG